MKANLKRLWQWLTRGDPWAAGTLAPLIVSLLIGTGVFLRILAHALMARASDRLPAEVWVFALGGTLVTGFICGLLYPRQALIWSTGFSWPLILWGLFCLPFALFEGPGLLIWLLASMVMAALAVLGAVLARRLRRCQDDR